MIWTFGSWAALTVAAALVSYGRPWAATLGLAAAAQEVVTLVAAGVEHQPHHARHVALDVVVPVVALGAWLVAGPRGGQVRWAFAVPWVWVAVTLLRGEIASDWPHPWIDVSVHGWGHVLLRLVLFAAVLAGVVAALARVDRRLSRT